MESLFKEEFILKSIPDFPRTRYQGSKYKLLYWIWENISFLDFDNVADLFGGTASVSYLFKTQGKSVIYNDLLKSNYFTGLAFIENDKILINDHDINNVLQNNSNSEQNIISRNFQGIYFNDEENLWLDKVVQNIHLFYQGNVYKKALLLWAIFQACIIKRPFNLFHRKNLYMRTNDVKRSFGNKTTWDKPFEYYFIKFLAEANNAVFDNGRLCKAYNQDAVEFDNTFDLVYIDTPYISQKGVGVDYYHFYHFLEGIADYFTWEERIDFTRKHNPLLPRQNRWVDKNRILQAFNELIEHYKKSHIVISYRSDGIPAVEELIRILKKFKKNYKLIVFKNYKYVLSKNNNSDEILLIGWD